MMRLSFEDENEHEDDIQGDKIVVYPFLTPGPPPADYLRPEHLQRLRSGE